MNSLGVGLDETRYASFTLHITLRHESRTIFKRFRYKTYKEAYTKLQEWMKSYRFHKGSVEGTIAGTSVTELLIGM